MGKRVARGLTAEELRYGQEQGLVAGIQFWQRRARAAEDVIVGLETEIGRLIVQAEKIRQELATVLGKAAADAMRSPAARS